MPLSDLQQRFRDALVTGDAGPVAPALVGGADPRARLAIHQRHDEASLVRALLERFPATQWLVGSQPVIDAAREFVRRQPPAAPCIAEYGETFGAHLAASPIGDRVPYVRAFIVWSVILLGCVAVAILLAVVLWLATSIARPLVGELSTMQNTANAVEHEGGVHDPPDRGSRRGGGAEDGESGCLM